MCGHTFCGVCLKNCFLDIYKTQITAYPKFAEVEGLTEDLKKKIGHPDSNREAYNSFTEEVEKLKARCLRGPHYTCPDCKACILYKPYEVYALKTIVGAVAKAHDELVEDKGNSINDFLATFFKDED